MHSPLFLTLCTVLYISCPWVNADGDDDKRLLLHPVKHQPCNGNGKSSYERIRFPPMEIAPLRQDPDREAGCYIISGPVSVLQPIRGTVQVYLDMRYGTSAPPEPCQGADSSNCGGYGSCVFCYSCSNMKNITQKTQGLVQLQFGKKTLNCEKGLKPGNYTDVSIVACMPTVKQFCKKQNAPTENCKQMIASGRLVFLTIYVFNKDVSKLPKSEREKIATHDGDQVIGCHKMVGSVSQQ